MSTKQNTGDDLVDEEFERLFKAYSQSPAAKALEKKILENSPSHVTVSNTPKVKAGVSTVHIFNKMRLQSPSPFVKPSTLKSPEKPTQVSQTTLFIKPSQIKPPQVKPPQVKPPETSIQPKKLTPAKLSRSPVRDLTPVLLEKNKIRNPAQGETQIGSDSTTGNVNSSKETISPQKENESDRKTPSNPERKVSASSKVFMDNFSPYQKRLRSSIGRSGSNLMKEMIMKKINKQPIPKMDLNTPEKDDIDLNTRSKTCLVKKQKSVSHKSGDGCSDTNITDKGENSSVKSLDKIRRKVGKQKRLENSSEQSMDKISTKVDKQMKSLIDGPDMENDAEDNAQIISSVSSDESEDEKLNKNLSKLKRPMRKKSMIESEASEMESTDVDENPVTDNENDEQVTVLDNWIIQAYHAGIRVEGHKLGYPADEFWHSSLVTKRISSHLVETGSGKRYRLVGKMDRVAMENQGNSELIIKKFENGFPVSWKSLVEQYIRQVMAGKSDTDSTKKVKVPAVTKNSTEKKNTPTTKKTNPKAQEKSSSKKTVNKRKSRESLSHKVAPLLSNSLLSGVKEAGTLEDPLVLDNLPRTRSGRPIIPQLSWWTGQRIVIQPLTQAIQILPGTPDSNSFIDSSYVCIKHDESIGKKEEQAQLALARQKQARKLEKNQTISNNTSQNNSNSTKKTLAESGVKRKVSTKRQMSRKRHSHPKGENSQSETETKISKGVSNGQGDKLGTESENNPDTSFEEKMFSDDEDDDKNSTEEEFSLEETLARLEESSVDQEEVTQADNIAGGDNVNLMDGADQAETDVLKNARAKRAKQKKLLKPTPERNGNPRITLTNVLDVEQNTPQALLLRALDNMPTNERKTFKGKAVVHKKNNKTGAKSQNVEVDVLSQSFSDKNSVSRRRSTRRSLPKKTSDETSTAPSDSEASVKVTNRVPNNSKRLRKTPQQDKQADKGTSTERTAETEQSNGTDTPWTATEIERFESARKELPVAEPWFWQALATQVGTRSVQECRDFYFKGAPSTVQKKKPRTKPRQNKETVTEPSQITGGKGTLKRKRQFRELIENHDKDYVDDIFGSTPYRNMQQVKIPKVTVPDLQRIADEFRTPGGPSRSSKTPRSNRSNGCADIFKTPSHRPGLPMPVSEKKTPISGLVSPGFLEPVDREQVEGYVHRLKKGHRGRQWGVVPHRNTTVHTQGHKIRKMTDVDLNLFDDDLPGKGAQEVDEEDHDYYFSDCE